MGELRSSNPYNLKTKPEEGYLHEEIPAGYLSSGDFINFLNRKKIQIDRDDNLGRFCNNNGISMVKVKRDGSGGSTPYAYKIPSDSKIEEIILMMKNNNNSLLGRKILKQKKEKIIEIFDNAPSARDYDKKIEAAKDKNLSKKQIDEIITEKWNKCYSKTSLAEKVSEVMGVNCNRKLVAKVLEGKRSSQEHKLLKKKEKED
tara:strand:+ start:32 stop:637 length:606 start_codon:yes stop_codon:yes gene_type:complete